MAYGAHVQSIAAAPGNGPVQSLAFTSNVTAGNTLGVALRFGNGYAGLNVADTLGNTYAEFTSYTNPEGIQFACFYVLSCVASGANTVTVTITDTGSIRIILAEYEGASILNTGAGTGANSAAASSGNFTTTVATTLLLGVGSSAAAVDWTPGANYTERQEIQQRLALEDRVVTATGTYTAAMTLSAATGWVCLGVAFRQATAGKVTKNTRARPLGIQAGYPRRQGLVRR